MALSRPVHRHRSAYERTVGEVFADSRPGVFVPVGAHRSVGELLRASFAARWWILIPVIAAAIGSWPLLFVMSTISADAIQLPIALFGAVCGIWGARYRTEQLSDRDVFFAQYAQARGLEFSTNNAPRGCVPLMRSGDEQVFEHLVHGQIGGVEATFGNFTYIHVQERAFGQREENRGGKFLVLHVRLPRDVATRYRGVHVRPRGATDGAGNFRGTRSVHFESIEFKRRYDVLVTLTQDDIALYELFTPPFIEALTRGPRIAWQQTGTDLVFYRPDHCDVTIRLDRFVIDAQVVVKRYLEEWQ